MEKGKARFLAVSFCEERGVYFCETRKRVTFTSSFCGIFLSPSSFSFQIEKEAKGEDGQSKEEPGQVSEGEQTPYCILCQRCN